MTVKCKMIIACIDPRFRKQIETWAGKKYGPEEFAIMSFVGSTKEISDNTPDGYAIINQLKKAAQVLEFDTVIIIHHNDCGGYGISDRKEEKKKQLAHMKKSTSAVKRELPGKTVSAVWANMNFKSKRVRFSSIEV